MNERDESYFSVPLKGESCDYGHLEFWPKLQAAAGEKSVVWLIDMLRKFTKFGQLVVGPCVDRSSTAKACMLLPKPHQCFESEEDRFCFGESLSGCWRWSEVRC